MSMNVLRPKTVRLTRIASFVAVTTLALALHSSAAQPSEAPHPAHIHSGTCQTLGDVVVPLTDVAPLDATGAVGASSAIPVEMSVNQVDMPLQKMIDGEYAVNIHKSADEIDTYIACGAIGGVVSDDGLVIGLGELNNSGFTGVALLKAAGDKTDVTVFLTQGPSGGATTAAQEAAPAAANGEPVEIKGFAFNPPTIEVPVGGSITWTNDDTTPHTATAKDRAILQSGAIAPGTSFTQTFNTPGTYEYFCEFHPNMHGTIVVK
jgi:plastocyanin